MRRKIRTPPKPRIEEAKEPPGRGRRRARPRQGRGLGGGQEPGKPKATGEHLIDSGLVDNGIRWEGSEARRLREKVGKLEMLRGKGWKGAKEDKGGKRKKAHDGKRKRAHDGKRKGT